MPVNEFLNWKPEVYRNPTEHRHGISTEVVYPPGKMYQDPTALTDYQDDCTNRLGMTIQIEQNSYLLQHPEIGALLKILISKASQSKNGFKEIAKQVFRRPVYLIEDEIRKTFNIPYGEPFNKNCPQYKFKDLFLENDINKLTKKHYPEVETIPSASSLTSADTVSSSFLSIITSQTTVPTPEKVPTPEPTLSEIVFGYVQLALNKAVFLNVEQYQLLYDTAYVEMMRIVEDAIEITVKDIKEDIATLVFNAYQHFEINIMEKERIAAEIAWERRMRKKMKKTLRQLDNFNGYESPASTKSSVSSQESFKIPPPPPLRPCECHPKFFYNRYPKDRFGIYEPRDVGFSNENVTSTPPISLHEIELINDVEVN